MKLSIQFLILVALSMACTLKQAVVRPQNNQEEVATLLHTLCPLEVDEPLALVMTAPSEEIRSNVGKRLRGIAEESSQSRSQVIEALIQVVEHGPFREGSVAYRWIIAVKLLGELRATESIDTLVKNIGQTGDHMSSSMHYGPVEIALSDIGEPAIPRLLEALSDDEPMIRQRAISTLARIGTPALPKLEEALLSLNADTKCGAAWALAWIGGEEARFAIEGTIAIERDEAVWVKLNEALKEMYRLGRQ